MIDKKNAMIQIIESKLAIAESMEHHEIWVSLDVMHEILDLLKEKEGYVSVPFSWLVKFCTHIDFSESLTDAEREVAWRQKLRQQFGIDLF